VEPRPKRPTNLSSLAGVLHEGSIACSSAGAQAEMRARPDSSQEAHEAPLLPHDHTQTSPNERSVRVRGHAIAFAAGAVSALLVASVAVVAIHRAQAAAEIIPRLSSSGKSIRGDSADEFVAGGMVHMDGMLDVPEVTPMPVLDDKGFPVLDDVLPTGRPRARWGIVGPGRIARDFTAAIVTMGSTVHAVAAGALPGSTERAAEFAKFYGIPHAYGSYEELAADPDVDVVYIATTNHLHYTCAALMLRHGKHVLLEKPATISPAAFADLMALAKARGLLLVTNFWTRWFPAMKWAENVIKSGKLGPVVHVAGDMAFQAVRASPGGDRFMRSDLGGGALLDMGCYLVQFATLFLAGDHSVAGPGHDGFNVKASGDVVDGIDMETAFVITNGPAAAAFGTSLNRASDFTVKVYCTHGMVTLQTPANCPTYASYHLFTDATGHNETPVPCCGQRLVARWEFEKELPKTPAKFLPPAYPNGMGFVYSASAVERCLYTPGCTELEEMPLAQQMLIVNITAEVARQVGIFQDLGPGVIA